MPGRRPKPDEIKEIEGNPGKRPLNRRAPKSQAGNISCPKWLSKYARECWDELAPLLSRMRVLTDGDRNMLSMACAAYAEYREADDFLREPGRGTTYETTTAGGETMFRPYPQVGQRNDAWRRYKSGLVEMGLTPAARTRVSQIGEGEDEQSEWDGL